MITITGLRKEFDNQVVALDNFNLIIEDRQFIALLGPSGCGKSTTLNCMAGLLDVTAGTICFDGVDVTHAAPKDRNIGMVFQSYALYPHLVVIDNIAFPLKQKGIPKAERHEKARSVARKLQIEHLLNRKPDQLSGGQQQRVAMCRAIIKEPKILLLDEPMSNLDARLKIEIREVIKQLQQDLQITCILVTHDQEEAMALADKIAVLDDGAIQQYDTPQVLYNKPANLFVANFMGSPPMNFIDAKLHMDKTGNSLSFPGTSIACPVALKESVRAQTVQIGVRAHQVDFSLELSPSTGHTIPLKIRLVEDLGKELLVYGNVGTNPVRITTNKVSLCNHLKTMCRSEKNEIFLHLGDDFNVFSAEDGINLVEGR